MIYAQNVVKHFGSFRAVGNLNLSVGRGECFGLLGPNGAGKSTFINMLYGTVLRTSGTLKVFGLDPAKNSQQIKQRLGVVTQDNALDDGLSVYENMRLYCSFLGVPQAQQKGRIEELLEYMNLEHKRDARIHSLSGGMKRRLVFVRALLGEPELLILDEPTTGLDPAVRHLLWQRVQELHRKGVTILLTTHYMHEAEVLCQRLAIFNEGQVISEGSPQQLIRQHAPGFIGIYPSSLKERLTSLVAKAPNYHLTADTSGVTLRAGSLEEITKLHTEADLNPLQIRPANLEDVFLKLTGTELKSYA